MIDFDASEIREALEAEIAEIMREDAFAILTNVVLATPVGDPTYWQSPPPPGYVGGHARRNWNVTIGASNDAELSGVDPGGRATIQQGRAALAIYREPKFAINIQNAAPYIVRLDDGYSPQARPANFVQRATDAALRRLPKEEI